MFESSYVDEIIILIIIKNKNRNNKVREKNNNEIALLEITPYTTSKQ
jgi:hypothetical protein